MGLSQRRRAKHRINNKSTLKPREEPRNVPEQRMRTGNTLRRIPDGGRHRDVLKSQVFQFSADSRSHGALAVPNSEELHENVNHNRHKANIEFNGSRVDTRVHYSLKKRKQWEFVDDLSRGRSGIEEDVNLVVLEHEARIMNSGRMNRNCTGVKTNFNHVLKLKEKVRSEEVFQDTKKCKRWHTWTHEDVKEAQHSQSFVSDLLPAKKRYFDESSLNFNFTNVPQSFRKQDKEVLEEFKENFESKPLVTLSTVTPGYGRRNCKFSAVHEKCRYSGTKKRYQMWKDKTDDVFDSLCIEDDAENFECDDQNIEWMMMEDEEEVAIDVEDEPAAWNILDYVKTPVQRAPRRKKVSVANSHRSSGYESLEDDAERPHIIFEDVEDVDEASKEEQEKAEAEEMKMLTVINDFIQQERPVVQMPKVTPESLSDYFKDGQTWWSSSMPSKFVVVMDKALTEAVVFEEVKEAAGKVEYSVLYASCKDEEERETFLCQLVTSEDPLQFLQQTAAFEVEENNLEVAAARVPSFVSAAVVNEDSARLEALCQAGVVKKSPNEDIDFDFVPESCPVCLTSADDDKFTTIGDCGHSFCNFCLVNHVTRSIARGASALGCPGHGCKTTLDAVTVLSCAPITSFRAWTSLVFQRWVTNPSTAAVAYCTNSKCNALVLGAANKNIICTCRTCFCLHCKDQGHWPMDCSTYQHYQRKMAEFGHTKMRLKDLESVAKVRAKNCPKCNVLVEKWIGCDHMTCVCGEGFCWWCSRPLRDHDSRGCGKGIRESSEFKVRKDFDASDLLKPSSTKSKLYCSAVEQKMQREKTQHRFHRNKKLATDLYSFYKRKVLKVTDADIDSEAKKWAEDLCSLTEQAQRFIEAAYVVGDSKDFKKTEKKLVQALGHYLSDTLKFIEDQMQSVKTLSMSMTGRRCEDFVNSLNIQQRLAKNICTKLHIFIEKKDKRSLLKTII